MIRPLRWKPCESYHDSKLYLNHLANPCSQGLCCTVCMQAYDSLPDGSYRFSVAARDASGNLNGAPVNHSWAVRLPVYAHITGSPTGDAADAGAAASDTITFVAINSTDSRAVSPPTSVTSSALMGSNSTTASSAAVAPSILRLSDALPMEVCSVQKIYTHARSAVPDRTMSCYIHTPSKFCLAFWSMHTCKRRI